MKSEIPDIDINGFLFSEYDEFSAPDITLSDLRERMEFELEEFLYENYPPFEIDDVEQKPDGKLYLTGEKITIDEPKITYVNLMMLSSLHAKQKYDKLSTTQREKVLAEAWDMRAKRNAEKLKSYQKTSQEQ